ncbi:protein of unknown function [Cupriavidus taiwanensis]|uniref:Uncharacterized protein n=1 Tax=Cupriavidus taiwanensis TaxID=164546 RepID=A0A9Q7UQH0_9BURK|nr:protein of unknown function [Cupriavidus taiwanensis]
MLLYSDFFGSQVNGHPRLHF